MPRRDLLQHDASKYASDELEYVISTTGKNAVKKITAEEAMTKQREFRIKSERNTSRVLFISTDTELLNPTKQTLDGYVDIKDLFSEVHILVLRRGAPAKYPVIRVEENVWLYTVSTTYWWQTYFAGWSMLERELVFASGFRPDLIVARDPYESALLAARAGSVFNRPTQVHVFEDYTDPLFYKGNLTQYLRSWLPRFTLPRFVSARVFSSALERVLKRDFAISDLAVLPKYQNYQTIIDQTETVPLASLYKPHILFLTYYGRLTYDCALHQVLSATKDILTNPRIALLIIGDGPARKEFERKIKVLGIERQVIFLPSGMNEIAYLRSSHILVVPDTDSDSEEVVLKGAAAGVPLVMARTDRRLDVFTHGESAFLYEPSNLSALSDRIVDLLSDVSLRKQFQIAARDSIRDRFHAHPMTYQQAYRASIEEALFAWNAQ